MRGKVIGRGMAIGLLVLAGAGTDPSASAAPRVDAFPFVKTGFSVMRQGPDAKSPLLSVIPPAARVQANHCGSYWTPGRCEATYGGFRSWIEPAALWRQKTLAQKQLAFAGQLERRPLAKLDDAEERSAAASARRSPEHQSFWSPWRR